MCVGKRLASRPGGAAQARHSGNRGCMVGWAGKGAGLAAVCARCVHLPGAPLAAPHAWRRVAGGQEPGLRRVPDEPNVYCVLVVGVDQLQVRAGAGGGRRMSLKWLLLLDGGLPGCWSCPQLQA